MPSGSFRVKVYAGTNPVTGKERLLRQTCLDEAAAHVALGRLLTEADGGRFPDRDATLARPSTGISKSPTWKCRPKRRARATSAAPSGRCS